MARKDSQTDPRITRLLNMSPLEIERLRRANIPESDERHLRRIARHMADDASIETRGKEMTRQPSSSEEEKPA